MTHHGALGFLAGDDVHQQAAVDRVKALGRFVQDEELGFVHGGRPELDLLLLPPRACFLLVQAALFWQAAETAAVLGSKGSAVNVEGGAHAKG